MRHNLLVLILAIFALPTFCIAQDDLSEDFQYDIKINYPSLSIEKDTLLAANTLLDLNKYYKASWVKTYSSVEILTIINGELTKASSPTDQLTEEQKDIMYRADVGSAITVKARYMPDNTLSHNEIQEFDFTFTINPDNPAEFEGGHAQLQQYVKDKAIDHIAEDIFTGYKLAAVTFTVNTDGEIVDAENFWTSEDESVDALLLQTICDMPAWTPAAYADGTRVNQDFVLTVGNMQSCVVNLLNIDGSVSR